MFDSADVYSDGLAEQILGEAIKGKRDRLLISTKATFPSGDGPNDYGSSRQHLVEAVDKAAEAPRHRPHRPAPAAWPGLQHAGRGDAGDARSARARRQGPLHRLLELLRLASDEVAGASGPLRLPALRRAPGLLLAAQPRLRVGADAARPRPGRRRRDLEPARAGASSPARSAAASRQSPAPAPTTSPAPGPHFDEERLFRIVDALDAVATETGKTVPQVALNWLLQRPTVSTSSSAHATRRNWSRTSVPSAGS